MAITSGWCSSEYDIEKEKESHEDEASEPQKEKGFNKSAGTWHVYTHTSPQHMLTQHTP